MRNKIISLFILSVVFGFSFNFGNATDFISSSNSYNNPIIINDFQFEAELSDDGYVKTSWNIYNRDEKLKYYKIVRSSKNTNPVYPDDGYIKYSSNVNFTEYIDYKISDGTNYYRVCAITYENNRYCSNVVKIYKEKNENVSICTMEYAPVCGKKDGVKKTYSNKCMLKSNNAEYLYYGECLDNNDEQINNTSNLNFKIKSKADILIKTFVLKVEKKYTSNEKRIEILENVIEKFNELANKKIEFKELLNYINLKLNTKISSYNDGFTEIESILNDF